MHATPPHPAPHGRDGQLNIGLFLESALAFLVQLWLISKTFFLIDFVTDHLNLEAKRASG